MKNSYVIGSLSRTLAKTCETIEMMVNNTNEADQQTPEVSEVYHGLILDELAHAQIIVLNLTKMLTGEDDDAEVEHIDEGSVFAAGDLDTKKKRPLEASFS